MKRYWQSYEKNIVEEVYKLTGMSINTKNITCWVDSSTTNGSYGHTTIYLGTKGGINREDALMVITHELFHIFYWRKIKKDGLTKSSMGFETKEEWKLSEVAVFLLTNETSLKKYWKNSKVYIYPEIKDVYNKVKKYWKIGDINYFLINSYKLINGSKIKR